MARVVVFAKAPVMGRVKTRLAADIGAVAATHFYRQSTEALLRRLDDPRWQVALAVTPDTAVHSSWWPEDLPRRGQGGGDLGARMHRVLTAPGAEPVLIVGSDIPGITRADIAAAFSALRSADLVVGAAEDGGYWLIGTARRPGRRGVLRTLFRDVRWSGPHALADTRASLPPEARVAQVRPLADVDTGADFARWRKEDGRSSQRA